VKLCTVCGVVTSRAGQCTTHARQSTRSRHNALYSTRAWQRLSARVLRAWRGEQGNWCPGFERRAHRASDLTVDHVVPLGAGGAPFDIANTSVLCRSCNSTKDASTGGDGVAHRATLMPPDRDLGQAARAERPDEDVVAVGAEVFDTVLWAGRFAEAAHRVPVVLLPRRAVKLALCGDSRARDANIRQALIDRFGGTAASAARRRPARSMGSAATSGRCSRSPSRTRSSPGALWRHERAGAATGGA
jgi:5-methylcytosine-specific restriction protein A